LVDYVSPPQLVTHGKFFEGSTMLHGECLPYHLVKVMVETVCYGDVVVPMPTLEVGIISHAVGTFIAWPKHLVRMHHTLNWFVYAVIFLHMYYIYYPN